MIADSLIQTIFQYYSYIKQTPAPQIILFLNVLFEKRKQNVSIHKFINYSDPICSSLKKNTFLPSSWQNRNKDYQFFWCLLLWNVQHAETSFSKVSQSFNHTREIASLYIILIFSCHSMFRTTKHFFKNLFKLVLKMELTYHEKLNIEIK